MTINVNFTLHKSQTNSHNRFARLFDWRFARKLTESLWSTTTNVKSEVEYFSFTAISFWTVTGTTPTFEHKRTLSVPHCVAIRVTEKDFSQWVFTIFKFIQLCVAFCTRVFTSNRLLAVYALNIKLSSAHVSILIGSCSLAASKSNPKQNMSMTCCRVFWNEVLIEFSTTRGTRNGKKALMLRISNPGLKKSFYGRTSLLIHGENSEYSARNPYLNVGNLDSSKVFRLWFYWYI